MFAYLLRYNTIILITVAKCLNCTYFVVCNRPFHELSILIISIAVKDPLNYENDFSIRIKINNLILMQFKYIVQGRQCGNVSTTNTKIVSKKIIPHVQDNLM